MWNALSYKLMPASDPQPKVLESSILVCSRFVWECSDEMLGYTTLCALPYHISYAAIRQIRAALMPPCSGSNWEGAEVSIEDV